VHPPVASRREIAYTGSGELMIVVAILIPLAIACFGFWLWMLIDCATNEPDTGNNKVVWIIIIVCAHIIGAVLYWIMRRDRRIAEIGH
jgi:hypothetical protein